jgi:hypothetical protein
MSYWPDGDFHRTCHHKIYYLTCEQFETMWADASGRCQICGRSPEETPRGQLGIDHDNRRTDLMFIRGLLCNKCNSGMRYIDNGFRAASEDQKRYLNDAWFVRNGVLERYAFFTSQRKDGRQSKPWRRRSA